VTIATTWPGIATYSNPGTCHTEIRVEKGMGREGQIKTNITKKIIKIKIIKK